MRVRFQARVWLSSSQVNSPERELLLSYYEPAVSKWFKDLDNGIQLERFGFHIFRSDLFGNRNNAYTLNAYFYLPRGIQQLDEVERIFYRDYLLSKIEQMLPGIRRYLVYSRIITPDDFVAMHGLSSRVMRFITSASKPANETAEPGYFRAGHTVFPPGEHAGAAALSGHLVAKCIVTATPKPYSRNTRNESHEDIHQQA